MYHNRNFRGFSENPKIENLDRKSKPSSRQFSGNDISRNVRFKNPKLALREKMCFLDKALNLVFYE